MPVRFNAKDEEDHTAWGRERCGNRGIESDGTWRGRGGIGRGGGGGGGGRGGRT